MCVLCKRKGKCSKCAGKGEIVTGHCLTCGGGGKVAAPIPAPAPAPSPGTTVPPPRAKPLPQPHVAAGNQLDPNVFKLSRQQVLRMDERVRKGQWTNVDFVAATSRPGIYKGRALRSDVELLARVARALRVRAKRGRQSVTKIVRPAEGHVWLRGLDVLNEKGAGTRCKMVYGLLDDGTVVLFRIDSIQ